MEGVSFIQYTVVSDDLLVGSEKNVDSVHAYIDTLMDTLEEHYPTARVIVMELQSGADADGHPRSTVVEIIEGTDHASVVAHVDQTARDLWLRGSWADNVLRAA